MAREFFRLEAQNRVYGLFLVEIREKCGLISLCQVLTTCFCNQDGVFYLGGQRFVLCYYCPFVFQCVDLWANCCEDWFYG